MCQLLCELSDLFSSGADDLGSTDLVKHEIRTGMQSLFDSHPEDYICSKGSRLRKPLKKWNYKE